MLVIQKIQINGLNNIFPEMVLNGLRNMRHYQ